METSRSVAKVLDKSDDSDDLIHILCGHCLKIAEEHGWKTKAFCGALGRPAGNGRSKPAGDDCLVCDEMATRVCTTCGYRPLVIR